MTGPGLLADIARPIEQVLGSVTEVADAMTSLASAASAGAKAVAPR